LYSGIGPPSCQPVGSPCRSLVARYRLFPATPELSQDEKGGTCEARPLPVSRLTGLRLTGRWSELHGT
jgi:hypothetical protein